MGITFKNDISGQIINEARGKSEKSPNMTVTVLDSDKGKTIAEVLDQGEEAVVAGIRTNRTHGTDLLNGTKISSSVNAYCIT